MAFFPEGVPSGVDTSILTAGVSDVFLEGIPAGVKMSTTAEICVRVRLFASYREAAGTREFETPLPSGARVRDLIALLEPRLPSLRTAPGMVAVNHTYVGPDFQLHDGDEAAFIPPVSGGR
jgi:molybdopterin converting factor subunit 1